MSVRNALLGLLAQRPRHGYELHAAFEAVVGGEQNWDVKPAQIYTTLARLEKDGLVKQGSVEQASGPEKRIYVITPAGQAASRPSPSPRTACSTAAGTRFIASTPTRGRRR